MSAAAPSARRLTLLATLLVGVPLFAGFAVAQQQTFNPRDESPEELPAGPGRDETFYSCTACHGFKLVAQQGMSRRQWEDTLVVMTQRHGMPALEGDDRELVLKYLETHYPPTAAAPGGWQNPFLNR
ncbi:MAG: hypothetical protein Q8M26_13665 [Pseudolabrys sp.]|nr:hypothetical protein [Pseudolabrys sp.]